MRGEQLSFFNPEQDPGKKRRPTINLPIDIVILFSIVLILLLALTFSLGVEHGRKKALLITEKPQEMNVAYANAALSQPSVPTQITIIPAETKLETVEPPKPIETKAKPISNPVSGYIIQLASYKDKTLAVAEAEKLKTKGYKSQIKENGNYWTVFVCGFASKKEAQNTKLMLSKTYRDCFIKKAN